MSTEKQFYTEKLNSCQTYLIGPVGHFLEHTQVSTEDRSAEAAQHLEKAALLTARTHQVTILIMAQQLWHGWFTLLINLVKDNVDETFAF